MDYINLYNEQLPFVYNKWQGNKYIDNKFSNLDSSVPHIKLWDILKWQITRKKDVFASQSKNFKLEVIKEIDTNDDENSFIMWLGHATFFIKLGKLRFITDPVFYNIPFIKRFVNLPYDFNKIIADYVLISHAHRDHLDVKSLKTLINNNEYLECVMPLKASGISNIFKMRSLEMGWFQEYKINNDLSIIFFPAKHWHKRLINDFNKVLWGSYLIKYKELSIFFAGDTAYSQHFKVINSIVGSIDYCLLPIGAYKPQHIMKESHLSPLEAINAFNDLKGKHFIPMHYATFDLSDERLDEPLMELQNNIDPSILRILYIGQKLAI
ncbi:MAG: hypothetical protein A2X12_04265 [Bacteroidetes bacterium GWE2_29_8]|nr:MAG: hypothetical protein A2X12_04265 [Bacteroidetes bacterium GWE2_29_8]OFY24994.1 MAG: hypothetical protein A2X02_08105 [Bacteroidetes bacterium GWF2_29_10]